jgi:hypothetical protein
VLFRFRLLRDHTYRKLWRVSDAGSCSEDYGVGINGDRAWSSYGGDLRCGLNLD